MFAYNRRRKQQKQQQNNILKKNFHNGTIQSTYLVLFAFTYNISTTKIVFFFFVEENTLFDIK